MKEQLTFLERFKLRKVRREVNYLMSDYWEQDKTAGQVFQEYFRATLGKYRKPRVARATWRGKND